MSIDLALKALAKFQGRSLTDSLAEVERSVAGLKMAEVRAFCDLRGIDNSFMSAAASIKAMVAQINVIIHAAGILCSLPHILASGEVVEEVSLGAGNTGKLFDLTTNRRVAEFKFIDWQGGPESIRQNGVFKDFFSLAEHDTPKSKHLYVVGTALPLKFLRGGRALSSVLSKQPVILRTIGDKYPGIKTVREYYELKQDQVEVCDVSPYIGRIGT
jgi:hypothetical protein